MEIKELLKSSLPKFHSIYNLDTRDFYSSIEGKFLPYVAIGDLAKYYQLKFKQKDTEEVKLIEEFILKLHQSEDDYLVGLSVVGFLESLDPSTEYYGEIKNSLPKPLKESLEEVDALFSQITR